MSAALEGPATSAASRAAQPRADAVLEAWRTQVLAAGVACKGLALHARDDAWRVDFPAHAAAWQARWLPLRERVAAGQPLLVDKGHGDPAGDWLVGCLLALPGGTPAVLGVVLAAPHSDRQVQVVALALGSLQLALSREAAAHEARAVRLLDLLGHVGAQASPRAAAQDWINRTAALLREVAPQQGTGGDLNLFLVDDGVPRWAASADAASAEPSSAEFRPVKELAAQCAIEGQVAVSAAGEAYPAWHRGDVVAVLVRSGAPAVLQAAPWARSLLHASLVAAAPLLCRWQEAQRSLPRHLWDATRRGAADLVGPGHWGLKLGALALGLGLAALLALPLPDRVAAAAVIEGQARLVVTAPIEGFLKDVAVRPGDRVQAGQVLARLDDRDLKLEQRRFAGEREQAAAKLRRALAEREPVAVALAQADMQRAASQLQLVEARLARTVLTAPRAGLVVAGDWVQQVGAPLELGKTLFELAEGSGYRVVLHVPDTDIVRLQAGQPGELRLAGQPAVAHRFTVATITATARVQDGVNGFRVEGDWDGPAPLLSPGMQGIGKVEVGRASLLEQWTRSTVQWLRLKAWAWGL